MEKEKKEYPANVNGYTIICEIGRGASAVVYKARCIPMNKNVAIKILDLESSSNALDTSVVCFYFLFKNLFLLFFMVILQ